MANAEALIRRSTSVMAADAVTTVANAVRCTTAWSATVTICTAYSVSTVTVALIIVSVATLTITINALAVTVFLQITTSAMTVCHVRTAALVREQMTADSAIPAVIICPHTISVMIAATA